MRGFTQLCQSLSSPTLVQERLSEFIAVLSQTVIDQEGIVNKFLGDGVMALFQGKECSRRAVKCAFSLVELFAEIKERWDEESNQQLDFLDIGIGITTDQVILGGIGNREVRDYTAIGTAVNLAAAFENDARDGRRILCDQLTYRNVRDIVAEIESPRDFLLQKPGQEVGIRYKCYHLQSLLEDHRVSVFISHSHKDRTFVEPLISQLKDHGVQVWDSVGNIPKGALWTREIRKAIANCNWMTVIVSQNSAQSKWIRREVDLAMAADHLEDRIIPIVIDETDISQVNEYLMSMQALFTSKSQDIPAEILERFRNLTNS